MPVRISLEWLREYVELPEDAERVAEALTMSGSKVDRVVPLGLGWEGVVVARIAALEPVSGSDHLMVAQVEHGGRSSQVVSGAPNLKLGDLVPLATVGTTLPNGLTIKARKMLGVASEGMLCSQAELGISAEADGIMVLGGDGPTGVPLSELIPADHVLIVDVTPNRPDELCHLGIARELAAVLGRPLREPSGHPTQHPRAAEVSVEIADPDLCARYVAREVFGVNVGPSPAWLQRRLRAVGQRPISNVVDAANYVMLELGQPLHAFDRAKLASADGKPARDHSEGSNPSGGPAIVVRRARVGETIACLDGKTRELPEGALLIADAAQPQAIAGIIGGAFSAVSPATTGVVIESANFLGTSIRATSRRLGLRTDASSRFEKQLHPELAPRGADRLAALLQEVAGGGASGPPVDAYPRPRENPPIRLRTGFVGDVLGEDLGGAGAAADIRLTLERAGFDVAAAGAELEITPPPFRLDVSAPEDLVEEVGRLRGYANLTGTLPGRRLAVERVLPPADVEWEAREIALTGGFDEVIGLSFANPRDPLMGHPPTDRRVLLLNPMTSEQDRMRGSLLPGLARIVKHNNDAGNEALRVFELGRVFWPRGDWSRARSVPGDEALPVERRMLAFAYQVSSATGQRAAAEVREALLAIKGVIADICHTLSGLTPEFEQDRVNGLHPGRSARIWLADGAGARVGLSGGGAAGDQPYLPGWIGELHPEVARPLDLRTPLVLAELDFDLLAAHPKVPVARPLSRYPQISRDIAISIPATRPARDVLAAVDGAGEAILRSVDLFDEYHGSQLPPGHKGLALRLVYAAPDRTLTGEEAADAERRILARLAADVGAEVRG